MHNTARCNFTLPGALTAYSHVSASRKFSFSKDTVGLLAVSLIALRPMPLSAAGHHCMLRLRLAPGFHSAEEAQWVGLQVEDTYVQ